MSLTVDVSEAAARLSEMLAEGEAAARLSEMLAEVEAGCEVVISRGTQPIAKLEKVPATTTKDVASVIADIRAARKNFAPTTVEEILEWRDEGRR